MARDIAGTNVLCENGHDASRTITAYFVPSARNMKLHKAVLKNSFGPGFWFREVDNRNIRIRALTVEDSGGHGEWVDDLLWGGP